MFSRDNGLSGFKEEWHFFFGFPLAQRNPPVFCFEKFSQTHISVVFVSNISIYLHPFLCTCSNLLILLCVIWIPNYHTVHQNRSQKCSVGYFFHFCCIRWDVFSQEANLTFVSYVMTQWHFVDESQVRSSTSTVCSSSHCWWRGLPLLIMLMTLHFLVWNQILHSFS